MSSSTKEQYLPLVVDGAEEEYSNLPQKTYNSITELFPFVPYAETDFWSSDGTDYVESMIVKFHDGSGERSKVKVGLSVITPLQPTFSFLVLQKYLHTQGILGDSDADVVLDSRAPTAVDVDGNMVILDGTHRMLTAYIAGETNFTVDLLR